MIRLLFIHIMTDKGVSKVIVKSDVNNINTYSVYLTSKPLTENLEVSYQVIVGDGLKSGVDFELVTKMCIRDRQTEERRLTVERNVPLDSLFMAYHMPAHCQMCIRDRSNGWRRSSCQYFCECRCI